MPIKIDFDPLIDERHVMASDAFVAKSQNHEIDQQFDWGHMSWLIDPGKASLERIGVGYTTFYPGAMDSDHYHMGSIQVAYIVSGVGYQYVNGVRFDFQAGDTLFIPPYAHHEMANSSKEDDLYVLGVYIPIGADSGAGKALPKPSKADALLLSLINTNVIEDILNRLGRTLNQSIKLIDHDGNCLISSSIQPSLCRILQEKCGGHCRRRLRKVISEIPNSNNPEMFICCGRIASIITPIVSNNITSGFLKCGEFFLNSGDREETYNYLKSTPNLANILKNQEIDLLLDGINVDKKNAIHAAAIDTLSVARFIAEMSVTMARQQEEEKNRLAMLEAKMAETKLKQALQEADLKLLESQLNPHFLFNTLNTIEHIAYIDGAEQISTLVLSLGKLLRTALGKTRSLIPINEEVDLLRSYLGIQKARFGPRLRDVFEVDPKALDCLIPGLTLQPLVENSIVHGIESSQGHCLLNVKIKRLRERLNIIIEDSGPGLADNLPEGVGLRSIRARLAHYFGQEYSFEIKNGNERGVIAEINLPALESIPGDDLGGM